MPNYTKDAIKWAFIKLLNERPLNKISVKSIVNTCNVSRNTFYYHFQDVPSLLEEIITDELDTLVREHTTGASLTECVSRAYDFAMKNKRAVYHIYHSVDREVYESFLMKMCSHAAKTYIGELTAGRDIPDKDRTALIHIMKCQFFGICIEWSKNDMKDDIMDSYRYTIKMFCDILDHMLAEKQP